jgi:hypothetical protein
LYERSCNVPTPSFGFWPSSPGTAPPPRLAASPTSVSRPEEKASYSMGFGPDKLFVACQLVGPGRPHKTPMSLFYVLCNWCTTRSSNDQAKSETGIWISHKCCPTWVQICSYMSLLTLCSFFPQPSGVSCGVTLVATTPNNQAFVLGLVNPHYCSLHRC